MPEYLSPGVYVEEVDRGPKPIEGVGTAMAAFVGFTEKADLMRVIDGEVVTEDLLNRPQLVTNWSQYVERFGGFVDGAYLPHSVYGYFHNGGSRCYVVSVKTIGRAQVALLGSDGKPALVARAKMAGFEGMRYRVKVEAGRAAGWESAEGRGCSEEGQRGRARTAGAPGAPASDPQMAPFTVTVERQNPSGAWMTKEVVTDVTLQEVRENGNRKVQVAFRNNRPPQFVDLFAPETSAPLAKIWPTAQQQSLNLEQRQLQAATSIGVPRRCAGTVGPRGARGP